MTGAVRADRLLADRGLRLADFASHPVSMKARLSLAETAALRLYTTPASESINVPLRDLARRERGEPHPLPVTVMLISKGVSKLRAVSNISEESPWKDIDLYCGMRNRELPEEFFPRGDTRLDLMSTTPCLDVALRYAASRPSLQGVIFRLRTQGSPERAAPTSPSSPPSLTSAKASSRRCPILSRPAGRGRCISATRLSPSSRWSQSKAEQCKSMMACGRP